MWEAKIWSSPASGLLQEETQMGNVYKGMISTIYGAFFHVVFVVSCPSWMNSLLKIVDFLQRIMVNLYLCFTFPQDCSKDLELRTKDKISWDRCHHPTSKQSAVTLKLLGLMYPLHTNTARRRMLLLLPLTESAWIHWCGLRPEWMRGILHSLQLSLRKWSC